MSQLLIQSYLICKCELFIFGCQNFAVYPIFIFFIFSCRILLLRLGEVLITQSQLEIDGDREKRTKNFPRSHPSSMNPSVASPSTGHLASESLEANEQNLPNYLGRQERISFNIIYKSCYCAAKFNQRELFKQLLFIQSKIDCLCCF